MTVNYKGISELPIGPATTIKATLSQRLFWPALEDDDSFERCLQLIAEYRPAVDELLLFTEGDGQDFRYIVPDEVYRRAGIMRKRADELRANGYAVSINVLNTIGHSDYADPFLDPLPWQGIVAPDGQVSTCCSCPRQPAFRDYVAMKYRAYAECGPGWIWVDDDVRLFAHFSKAMHGCYCETCLSEFSRRTCESWTRERLYASIVRDTYPAANKVRADWMHFLSDQVVEIHQLINHAVRGVDTSIRLAGMNTSFGWYTAYYSHFPERYEALRTVPDGVVRARPGGGAFSDERPADAYNKAWSIAHQIACYPDNTESHGEVENYPFQLFEKSATSTAREASLYLAAGCDGVTFDMSGNLGNDPYEHSAYYDIIASRRPYYDAIRTAIAGKHPVGMHVAFSSEHSALAQSDGARFESTDAGQLSAACGWGYLGIPLHFGQEPNGPSILHGQLAKGLEREALVTILDQGAVMDAEALEHLWKIGIGERVGIRSCAKYETGTYERFSDHTLNAGFSGYVREVSQGYYAGASTVFECVDGDMEPLAHLLNYRRTDLGVCALARQTAGLAGSRRCRGMPAQCIRRHAGQARDSTMGQDR